MGSLWRFCYFFYSFAWKSSNPILVTDENLLFSAKIDYFGKEWMQLDGSGLKLTKMCSLWRFCYFFYYFALKSSRFIWPATKTCFFGKNWIFWEGMDATRWFKTKIDKNAFTLRIFVNFSTILREGHQISFWPLTKTCLLAKIEYFGKEWMQLDGSRLKLTKCVHFDDFWWFFLCFATDSSKVVHFVHLQKIALFGKNWLSLGKNGCN